METKQTTQIKVEHQPSQERLNQLGVKRWPIWAREVSEFPWTYDSAETCYFLEGEAIVTPDGEQPVQVGQLMPRRATARPLPCERRFQQWVNHNISKLIVDKAKKDAAIISMENLTNIRQSLNAKPRNKEVNASRE